MFNRKKLLQYAVLLIVTAAFAAKMYVPKEKRSADNYFAVYHSPFAERMTEQEAWNRITALDNRIADFGRKGVYPIEDAYRIESDLQYISREAVILDENNNSNDGYVDAEAVYSYDYPLSNALVHAVQLRLKLSNSPAEQAYFAEMQSRNPQLWTSKTVITYDPWFQCLELKPRMYIGELFLIFLIAWRLWFVGFRMNRFFGPVALRIFGNLLAIGMSFCGIPAMALQSFQKSQKEKTANALLLNSTQKDTAVDSPVKQDQEKTRSRLVPSLQVNIFGDFSHDRQQVFTTAVPVSKRFDFVGFLQNREVANNPVITSHFAFGLRYRPLSGLALSAFAGPSYNFATKHFDITNVNMAASLDRTKFRLLSFNRISVPIDGKTAGSHRHIVAARASPMPDSVTFQAEFKKVRGAFTENFVGLNFSFGKWLSKSNKWIRGLYAYPYRDFVRNDTDLRLGFATTFAFGH